MRLVLAAGGVSALATDRARLLSLRSLGLWPPCIPTVVLTEALTGDGARDALANRLIGLCEVRPVDEVQAREAARLRTATGRAGSISAVDAVVAAVTAERGGTVLTSDPRDLRALLEGATANVSVVQV